MALPDATIDDGVLEGLRRREGAEGVRDGRTRLAKPLGELFLGQLVGLHQQLVGARRFDRVEAGALKFPPAGAPARAPALASNPPGHSAPPANPGGTQP